MKTVAPSKPHHRTKKRLLVAAVLAALIIGLILLSLKSDPMHAITVVILALREAGPEVFFLAMVLLPLLGVPLMPFTLAVGPAFGPVLGMGAVIFWAIAAVSVNVAISYGLAARVFRPSIARLAAFLGYQLPTASSSWHISAMVRLTPGLPFFAQSYILGVMRVPFASYMVVSTLIPTGYICGVVLLGDALWQGEGRTFFLAVSLLVLAGTISHFVRQRRCKPATIAQPPGQLPVATRSSDNP